jgi:hypothetical protein
MRYAHSVLSIRREKISAFPGRSEARQDSLTVSHEFAGYHILHAPPGIPVN